MRELFTRVRNSAAWQWLVSSSADPKKTSLLIRGLLVIGSGYVLNGTDFLCRYAQKCLPIDQTFITKMIDGLTDWSFLILAAVGAVMATWGAIRKVVYRGMEIIGWIREQFGW